MRFNLSMANPDPRRRRYVVTLLRGDDETDEAADRRLCEMLGITPAIGTSITATAYDAVKDEFRKLTGKFD